MSNRILIAEDETRIAAFVEKGLRSNGFTTTTVSDGIARWATPRPEASTLSFARPTDPSVQLMGRLAQVGIASVATQRGPLSA